MKPQSLKWISFLGILYFQEIHCVRKSGHHTSEEKKAYYILIAFIIAASFACCMYLRYKICPDDEIMFTDIQLDDIRLERVSQKERTILGRINNMKQKLVDMRKKKTDIETRRDITQVVETRLDNFNTKGRQIYGPAWDGEDGNLPVRELIQIPKSEIAAIRREAEIIATARKEEEKKDLWALWNDYGSDLPEKNRNNKSQISKKPVDERFSSRNIDTTDKKLVRFNNSDDDDNEKQDDHDTTPLLNSSTSHRQPPPPQLNTKLPRPLSTSSSKLTSSNSARLDNVTFPPKHVPAPPRRPPPSTTAPATATAIDDSDHVNPSLPTSTKGGPPPRPVNRKPAPPTTQLQPRAQLPPSTEPTPTIKLNRKPPPPSDPPPPHLVISPPKEPPSPLETGAMMRKPLARPPGAPFVLKRPNAPPLAAQNNNNNQMEHKED